MTCRQRGGGGGRRFSGLEYPPDICIQNIAECFSQMSGSDLDCLPVRESFLTYEVPLEQNTVTVDWFPSAGLFTCSYQRLLQWHHWHFEQRSSARISLVWSVFNKSIYWLDLVGRKNTADYCRDFQPLLSARNWQSSLFHGRTFHHIARTPWQLRGFYCVCMST